MASWRVKKISGGGGVVGGFGKLCVPLEKSWLRPWLCYVIVRIGFTFRPVFTIKIQFPTWQNYKVALTMLVKLVIPFFFINLRLFNHFFFYIRSYRRIPKVMAPVNVLDNLGFSRLKGPLLSGSHYFRTGWLKNVCNFF